MSPLLALLLAATPRSAAESAYPTARHGLASVSRPSSGAPLFLLAAAFVSCVAGVVRG